MFRLLCDILQYICSNICKMSVELNYYYRQLDFSDSFYYIKIQNSNDKFYPLLYPPHRA